MINCIAVDDEPLALELLEDNIKKIPFLNLQAKFTNAISALEFLQNENTDLIFLDIEMPHLSGLGMLKTLKNRPLVIFITAYEKYALQGFELDVLDYLLKPVPFDRFLRAAGKAKDFLYYTRQIPELVSERNPENEETNFIFVKSDYKIVKIEIDDILFVEGLKDYIKIYARNEKPIITLSSLKAIESRLNGTDFVRVHKSFIISVKKIDSISKSRINIGTHTIPISDSYRDILFGIIGKNQL